MRSLPYAKYARFYWLFYGVTQGQNQGGLQYERQYLNPVSLIIGSLEISSSIGQLTLVNE